MALPANAQTGVLGDKVLEAYGYNNDVTLTRMLGDVTDVISGLNCGAAMTRTACVVTNKYFKAELVGDLPKVRADMLMFFERRGGLQAALSQARAEQPTANGCGGKATVACKTLIDFFFAGGVLDQLTVARKKASNEVRPFYKDGRPFNG